MSNACDALRRTVGSIVMLGAAAFTASAGAAPFVVNDVEVCPARSNVQDPEFDSKAKLMTYMDNTARVRVVSVLDDGSLSGCAGVVVSQGIWGWQGAGGYNGPEWGRSHQGLELYFLKPLADGVTPALARARLNGGVWQAEYLDHGESRATLMPSVDEADAQPRLFYLLRTAGGLTVPMWRESTNAGTESFFAAAFDKDTGSVPRWIPGQRAMSLAVKDAQGVLQAARYDIDTGTTELLTSDAGNKSEIWVWSAPEFGGDLVFTTIVDGCCMRVYRRATGGAWTLVNNIPATRFGNLSRLFSPEPRVINGRSYVALQVGNQLFDPLAQIWVVGIDPARPFARRVSDNKSQAVRTEPEWFVSAAGAFVFYTVTTPQGKALRRAVAGLP